MAVTEEILALREKIAAQERSLIDAITESDLSSQDKTVELLAYIACKALETNNKLNEIHDELFQHTLALDNMTS
ncbi:hypothetical protein [Methylorubrum populi]|uniref:hypothetical protein n=1 Tax=Methylorubrum populi TaxID=223967 RepID=UPI002355FA92|nr:hypothetical protein [Methylorubrum populi]